MASALSDENSASKRFRSAEDSVTASPLPMLDFEITPQLPSLPFVQRLTEFGANPQNRTTENTLKPLPVHVAAATESGANLNNILSPFSVSAKPYVHAFPPSPPKSGGVTRGSISGAIAIEIFCGSAGLTAAMRSIGLDAVGIDHKRNRQAVKAPVMTADLATEGGQELLWRILQGENVAYIHCAPPCGTATRARERKVMSTLRRRGAPEPPPLRSSAFPLGFPTLTGVNAERVRLANVLYSFICKVCTFCHSRGIPFTIENPLTSYMWETPCFLQLATLVGVSSAIFSQCMHGGRRPVRRKWIGTLPHLNELNADCDGKHTHDPFTIQKVGGLWQFATADEATYPQLLCNRVAKLAERSAVAAGYSPMPTSIAEASTDPGVHRQLMRASVGKFVRGARFPNLISEFKQVVMLAASHHSVRSKQVGNKVQFGSSDSLQDGKILRLSSLGGDGSLASTPQFCVVGVFRSPLEYSNEAHSLVHPIDSLSVIPDALKKNVFWLLTTSPRDVVEFRLNAIRRITAMARQFSGEDSAMTSKLPADHKQVLLGKRLHLLKVLLQECDYPDVKIVDEVSEGLPLTGNMTVSNIFPAKLRTPLLTVDQLKLASKWIRPAMHARIVSSGNHAMDKTVWEETLKEKEKGWILGPIYSLDCAREAFGEHHLISRRFGLQQSDKCRVIDDYSESQVNYTVAAFEKIELQTVDDMTALIKCALDALTDDGRVFLSLSDGSLLSGHIPKGSTVEDQRAWVGKTFDLKSAYRQIPTRPEESWSSIIGVYDPEKQQAAYFKQVALPFGAVGSVYGFNRLARSIWAAACFHLRVTWCNYYDDFPAAELARTALATDAAIRAFFSIIGWTITTEPKKCLPYSRSFVMLGIVMNLEDCRTGVIKIDNKPERIMSISAIIQKCLDERKCSAPVADELCGKCQFAAGQIHGRMSLGLINLISAHRHGSTSCWMDEALLDAMKKLRDNLCAMRPRSINCRGDTRPILVFSDGAVEGEDMWQVTCGATILDVSDERAFMFGGRLPIRLIKEWRLDGRLQTIGQAEILPILLARLAIPQLFHNRRVFHFVDNDSARQAMVKGYSRSPASQRMIAMMVATECQQQTWSWYMRIPSESNPGDGPSRLRLQPAAENLNATCIPFPDIPEQIYLAK